MTTAILVGLPKPNHLKARVRAHVRNADGTIGDVLNEHVIDHGESVENYVHGGQVLVIEEYSDPVIEPEPVEENPAPGTAVEGEEGGE